MNERHLEDAFVPMPPVVLDHIDEAFKEVHTMNQKYRKPAMAVVLTIVAVLALAGTAVAAGIRWGALDFISAVDIAEEALPEARDALRTSIPQEGGVTDWAVFSLRESLSDGQYTWLVFDVTPTDKDTLLVTGGLSPNLPASSYSPELPEDVTLAQWVEISGDYARIMAVTIKPEQEEYVYTADDKTSWHSEADGAVSIMLRLADEPEEDGTHAFVCNVMPWWSNETDVRAPQKVTLTAHIEHGGEPLWTAKWTGQMPIPDSGIVVEEVELAGTVVGMYCQITYSAPNASNHLYPWLYPVDEQGHRLEWAAGNTFVRFDGVIQSTNHIKMLEDGQYQSYGSFAPLSEMPESLWISGVMNGDHWLEDVEIPLQ